MANFPSWFEYDLLYKLIARPRFVNRGRIDFSTEILWLNPLKK